MGAQKPLPTRTFDFSNLFVTWGTLALGGGLVSVKVNRAEDAWSYHVCADGTVTRVKNNNRMGQVVLTYGPNSPILDVLSQQIQIDDNFGTQMLPVEVFDANGRSIAIAPFAWLRKPPDAEYSKEAATREWTLDCDQLNHFVGGLT